MQTKEVSINEIVEYGLDSIDSNKSINVNLKDLLYIYKSVEELNRFFHQPEHYNNIEDVKKYLGDKKQGAFSIINNIYYTVFDKMLPQEIKNVIEDDSFNNPNIPFYYKR